MSGRSHTRASVGPRSAFFHRLGMQDPFALAATDERSDRARSELSAGNPFVFLSSAAYFEEVEASRYRLLQRLQASRESERIGERLERVGPVAMGVRPADTVLYGGMTTLTLPPEEVEELPEILEQTRSSKPRYADWPENQKTPARPRQPLVRVRPQPQQRQPVELPERQLAARVPFQRPPRRVARPMRRAYERSPRSAAGAAARIAEVVEQVAAQLRGPERDQLLEIVDTVTTSPTPARVETARRALQRLRGVAAARAREALAVDLPESAERPLDQARGRAAERGEAPTRGLRRVLQGSPALTVVEAPARAVEAAEESEPVAHTSPRTASPAIRRTKAHRSVSRRPSARVVGRAVLAERAARSELSRGPATASPRRSAGPTLARAARRRLAGDLDPTSASPLSSAATSWMRSAPIDAEPGLAATRRTAATIAPERVLAVPAPIDVDARPAQVEEAPEAPKAARTSRVAPVAGREEPSTPRASVSTARAVARHARQSTRLASSPVAAPLHPALLRASVANRELSRVSTGPSARAAEPGAQQPPALRALARGAAVEAQQRLTAAPVRYAGVPDALSLVLPSPELGSPEVESASAGAPSRRPVTPAAWRAARRSESPVRADSRGRSLHRSSPTAHVTPAAAAEVRTGQLTQAAARAVSAHRVSERGERLLAPVLPALLLAARQVVEEIERANASSRSQVGSVVRAASRSLQKSNTPAGTPDRTPLSRTPLTWLEPEAADRVLETPDQPDAPMSSTALIAADREGRVVPQVAAVTRAATERAARRDAPAVRLDRTGRALVSPVALSHLAPEGRIPTTEQPPPPARPRTSPVEPRQESRRPGAALAPTARSLGRIRSPSRVLPRSLVPQAVTEGDLSSLLPHLRGLDAGRRAPNSPVPERVLAQPSDRPEENGVATDRPHVAAAISAALRTQRSIVQVDAVRRATTDDVPDDARTIEAYVRAVEGKYRVRERRPTSATRMWLVDAPQVHEAEEAAPEAAAPEAAPRSRAAEWAEARAEAPAQARRWTEPVAPPVLPRLAAEEDAEADPLLQPVRYRTPSIPLGPMTLAATPADDERPIDADDAPQRGLRRTLGRLANEPDAPRTQAEARRTRRSRSVAPEARTLATPKQQQQQPGWARHAEGVGIDVPARDLPRREARVQTMGRLLGALARSGDPAEIVKVVLESSNALERAAADLPSSTRSMVERLVRAAGEQARSGTRATRLQPVQTRVLSQKAAPSEASSSAPGGDVASGGGGGGGGQARPTGASRVMKLAGKLMKLIHLAERERKAAEAERQVRMSEETGSSRTESGAGQAGGEDDDKRMNIKALRQDVLEAVLRELENLRWRREDPDGPSIWC